jgi:hypothetical protein
MRLLRHGQSGRWRLAVFIAVVGVHVLAGLLVFTTSTIRITRLAAPGAPPPLLWLSHEGTPQPSAASSAAIPEHTVGRKDTPLDIEPPPGIAAPEPSNAITLPLDLGAEADAAARRQADKEENERRRRNLAGPSDSQLEWSRNNVPLLRDYHQLNDIERAEGGEIVTWMNDKCFYTTHGISTIGLPHTSMVCKDPPKPETDLFKDMRKKLDNSAQGRAP